MKTKKELEARIRELEDAIREMANGADDSGECDGYAHYGHMNVCRIRDRVLSQSGRRTCYKLLFSMAGNIDALEVAVTNHLDAGFRLHGSPVNIPAGEGCGPGIAQAVVFNA